MYQARTKGAEFQEGGAEEIEGLRTEQVSALECTQGPRQGAEDKGSCSLQRYTNYPLHHHKAWRSHPLESLKFPIFALVKPGPMADAHTTPDRALSQASSVFFVLVFITE